MSVFNQFVKIIEKIDHNAEASFQREKYKDNRVNTALQSERGRDDKILLVPNDEQTPAALTNSKILPIERSSSPHFHQNDFTRTEQITQSSPRSLSVVSNLNPQKQKESEKMNNIIDKGAEVMKKMSPTKTSNKNDQQESSGIGLSSQHNQELRDLNIYNGLGLLPGRTIHIPLTLEEIEALLEPLNIYNQKGSNNNDTDKRRKDTVSPSTSQRYPNATIYRSIKALALAMGKAETQTMILQRSVEQLEKRCADQEEELLKRDLFMGKLMASWPSITGKEESDPVVAASHIEIQESLFEELNTLLDNTYIPVCDDGDNYNNNKEKSSSPHQSSISSDSSCLVMQRLHNLVCLYSDTITTLETSNAELRGKIHEDKTMKDVEQEKVSASTVADIRKLEDLQEEVRRRKVELSSLSSKWVTFQHLFDEKCHAYEDLRVEFSNFKDNVKTAGYRSNMFSHEDGDDSYGKCEDNNDVYGSDVSIEGVTEKEHQINRNSNNSVKGKMEAPKDTTVVNIDVSSNNKPLPITTNIITNSHRKKMLHADRSITSASIYRAIPEHQWWGRSVKRSISTVDIVAVRAGRYLWRHALLRCIVTIYIVMLHVYVFYIASSTVHSMHISGHDVYDHLENHQSNH